MAGNEALAVKLSAHDDFSAVFGKMIRGLDGLIGKHTKLFVGITAGIAVMRAAVDQAAKYERQLAKVNTMLSQGEAKFLPGYAKEMKRLAAISGQSTETLSDGLYDILSASRGAEDAIKILAATTRAAVGGFTDVSVATAGALTTLNAFRLENSAITSVLDKQFATVKRGRLTYEQYASTIGTLAATSSLAGQSLESMNAAVATVTRGGITAERAIVAINGAMLSFLKPTKVAIAAAKKFNIELKQNAIEGDNLGDTLKKLKRLRADELAQIFVERRAFKAMASLTQDLTGFMRDLGEQHDSVGRAAEATAKAEDTLALQAERSVEIFKNLGRTMGGPVADALKVTLQYFNDLATSVPEANKAIDEFLRAQRAGVSPAIISAAIEKDIPALEMALSNAGAIVKDWEKKVAGRKLLGFRFSDSFKQQGAQAAQAAKDVEYLVKKIRELRVAEAQVAEVRLDRNTKALNEKIEETAFLVNKTVAAMDKYKESLAESKKESSDIDEIYRLSLAKQKKSVSRHKEQVAKQTETRRLLREQADIKKEMEESDIKAAIADKERNEALGSQLENMRALTFGPEVLEAPVFADVPLGPERDPGEEAPVLADEPLGPDYDQQLMDYVEFTDGKLEADQGYFDSFYELMAATYDAQTTLAQMAAQQSVAFIDRSFSALEDEMMKSKASSKSVLQAMEKEAKRGLIRTGLDFLKNELKGLFITDKTKKAMAAEQAAEEKALRSAAYADQTAKVLGNVYGNTFSSIAAIPIVGPALAPGAATTAEATVAGVMASRALHGGLDEVPVSGDNKSYLLKGGERVLQPAANKEFMALMDTLRGFGQDNEVGGGDTTNSTVVKVYLGLSEIKDIIVETVNESSRDGDLNIDPRAITT